MIIKPQLVRGTAANSAIRLGLLGCGHRGTHVATSFANTTTARVVAFDKDGNVKQSHTTVTVDGKEY